MSYQKYEILRANTHNENCAKVYYELEIVGDDSIECEVGFYEIRD